MTTTEPRTTAGPPIATVALDGCDDDPVTQDLLTGIAAAVEEQAWMIRAHR